VNSDDEFDFACIDNIVDDDNVLPWDAKVFNEETCLEDTATKLNTR
jgi:hypothetical protein